MRRRTAADRSPLKACRDAVGGEQDNVEKLHPDPNDPDAAEQINEQFQEGMFRFEKQMGSMDISGGGV